MRPLGINVVRTVHFGLHLSPVRHFASAETERSAPALQTNEPEGLLLGLSSVKLLGEDVGLFAGDAAERDDVSLSIAAETVAAVDAASDFTRSEEARDNLALRVVDLGERVDLDAAHRVVNSRGDQNGVERALVEVARHIGTAESVLIGGLAGLPRIHRGLQRVGRNAHLAGDFIERSAVEAVLLLDVVVRGLQGLLHIAVEEQPEADRRRWRPDGSS